MATATKKKPAKKKRTTTKRISSVQEREPVERGKMYDYQDFLRRTGLGGYAMRQAKKKGLVVVELHGKQFVRGDDWFDYVERQTAPNAA